MIFPRTGAGPRPKRSLYCFPFWAGMQAFHGWYWFCRPKRISLRQATPNIIIAKTEYWTEILEGFFPHWFCCWLWVFLFYCDFPLDVFSKWKQKKQNKKQKTRPKLFCCWFSCVALLPFSHWCSIKRKHTHTHTKT